MVGTLLHEAKGIALAGSLGFPDFILELQVLPQRSHGRDSFLRRPRVVGSRRLGLLAADFSRRCWWLDDSEAWAPIKQALTAMAMARLAIGKWRYGFNVLDPVWVGDMEWPPWFSMFLGISRVCAAGHVCRTYF